ncbi:MAG: hypothetical protein NPIRA05_22410 [Nitrospirales bacterium]|nr:MAG: hypothetical protein NPIRA05_22410 [Nitrospirales bacterium]
MLRRFFTARLNLSDDLVMPEKSTTELDDALTNIGMQIVTFSSIDWIINLLIRSFLYRNRGVSHPLKNKKMNRKGNAVTAHLSSWAKADLLLSLGKIELSDKSLVKRLEKLCDKYKKAASRRNFFAHSFLGKHDEKVIHQLVKAKGELKVEELTYPVPAGSNKNIRQSMKLITELYEFYFTCFMPSMLTKTDAANSSQSV